MKKGQKHSDESRSKIRAARVGKPLSDETKQKLSKANSGKKRVFTDEHRKRLSEAARARKSYAQSEKNPMWRGSDVGYTALHTWIGRTLGKPKRCENCGTESAKAYDWANLSGEYRREKSDWKRLCRSCHTMHDGRGYEPKLIYSYDGKEMSLRQWARRLGVSYSTLYSRVEKQGLSFEEAITRPIRGLRPLDAL